MLLTGVSRRLLSTAPMFGIDAFEAQSGKGLLAQIAAIMATGRKMAEHYGPTNKEERHKSLGAALETGEPVLLYDNVETPLEGGVGAITEGKLQVRKTARNPDHLLRCGFAYIGS
jgi:putative DNA primase/helicase